MKKMMGVFFPVFVSALLFVSFGCSGINPHTDLGHPLPTQVDTSWGQLKKGMSQDQVSALLGAPIQIELESPSLTWVYPFGRLRFEVPEDAPPFSSKGSVLLDWKRY